MSLDRTSERTADAGRVGGGAWPIGARAAVRLAWAATSVAVLSGVLFLALLALNSRDPDVVTYGYWDAGAVTAIIFPVVGAIIVSRQSRNALGWLFCLMGLSSGLSGVRRDIRGAVPQPQDRPEPRLQLSSASSRSPTAPGPPSAPERRGSAEKVRSTP